MVLSTRSSTADAFIVSLDVTSAGVHALLFDAGARPVEGYSAQLVCRGPATPRGVPEPNPQEWTDLAMDCLDELQRQVHASSLHVTAVVFSVHEGFAPTSEPRSPAQEPAGGGPRVSFSGLLFGKLFGRERRGSPEETDRPERELVPEFGGMWPAYQGAAWFPPLDGGACEAIGAGSIALGRFSLSVDPVAALRTVLEARHLAAPAGIVTRPFDQRRTVVSVDLDTLEAVPAWTRRVLAMPKDTEARLEASLPGGHGLTLVPRFGEGRGTIRGLDFSTDPFDVFHAALESVALGFREAYSSLCRAVVAPVDVVASGAPLLRSPSWIQMMADALGRPVTASTEPYPAARGAALWALERVGAIEHLSALPASTGATFAPRADREADYDRLLGEQRALYARLFG